jgi:NitT/TauT family transport system permease protein
MTLRVPGPGTRRQRLQGYLLTGPTRIFTRHGRLRSPIATWALRLATFLAIMVFWTRIAAGMSRALLVPPIDVVGAILDLTVRQPVIWGAIYQSLGTLLIGLILSLPFGIAVGLLMGRYRGVEQVLDPYVTFLYVLPNIALIPVFVLWFGYKLELRLVLVFFSAIFPLIINTMSGVKSVDSELIDSARVFCATERQVVRTVVLPAALPFIFAGVRLGFSGAWVGVITAEITTLVSGIGGLIVDYASSFQTARMFVPILFIMLVGIVITVGMGRLERRLAPWRRMATDAE